MPNTYDGKDFDGNRVTLDSRGTAITGETLETGGYATLGWLSSLRKKLTDLLSPRTSVVSGDVTGITTTGAAMPTQACKMATLLAASTNTTNVLVGGTGGQTFPLAPGASKDFEVSNLNIIYRKMASGTGSIHWIVEL